MPRHSLIKKHLSVQVEKANELQGGKYRVAPSSPQQYQTPEDNGETHNITRKRMCDGEPYQPSCCSTIKAKGT
jgi:hypothetical protein